MRILLITAILAVVTLFAGCGAETTAGGAGILGGFAASNTLKGVQADLERREKAMILRYNQLVEAGAKAETLEELKKEISDTARLRQTAEVADSVASTRWNDPAAAGGALASIAAVAYAWVKRKDLNNTVAGIKAFRAKSDETTKHALDQILLDKKAVT